MIVKKIVLSPGLCFSFKRRYLYLVLIFSGFMLFICPQTQAGLDTLPVGARSSGMGGAYVALANTVDGLFLNPGGLAQITGFEVSLFYQKPFGLQEIDFGTISLSIPIHHFRIGLGVVKLGNELYNEQVLVLGFGHHYHRKIYYGLSFRYQSVQIANYGSKGKPGLDVGFIVPLSNRFNLGFFSKNINRPKIGNPGERLPQIFKTGISVRPNPKLILSAEIYKDVRFPQELRFGVEITPVENLSLRSGAANNPSRFSAGFGVKMQLFTLDYAFFTHNDLGLTHQFSLSVHLNKKQQEKPQPEAPPIVIEHETPQKTKSSAAQLQLNINTATAQELTSLPGIGETLAQRIVTYRQQNGPFLKIEELLAVKGIGAKTFEKLKSHVYVEQ